MYIFLLTNYFLEFSSGVIWWITSKTVSLLYNGVTYAFSKEEIVEDNVNIEQNYDSLSKEEIESLKKELKEIKELLVQNNKNK
tara:strand:- start:366 stop:614 length:249 start_codon:yes stop_codon:yes gene_type:complete